MGKQIESHPGLSKRYDVRIRHGWRGFDLHSQIERVAGFGFKGIELFIDGEDHGDLGGSSRFHLLQVRKTIERNGMRCTLTTNATQPSHLRQVIKLAVIVGAERIRANIGSDNGDEAVSASRICQDLRTVSPLLARHDICLVINGGQHLGNEKLEAILADLCHPLIRGEQASVADAMPADQFEQRPGLLAAILEMRQQIKEGRFAPPSPPWVVATSV